MGFAKKFYPHTFKIYNQTKAKMTWRLVLQSKYNIFSLSQSVFCLFVCLTVSFLFVYMCVCVCVVYCLSFHLCVSHNVSLSVFILYMVLSNSLSLFLSLSLSLSLSVSICTCNFHTYLFGYIVWDSSWNKIKFCKQK